MLQRLNSSDTSVTFRDFYFDAVSSALIMLLSLVVFTILSITISNSRIDGMGSGLIIGYLVSLGLFYYLRSRVNLYWSIVQIALNALLTIAGFSALSLLLDNSAFFEASYGYLAIIFLTPMLQSISKQVLDYLTFKFNATPKVRRFRF